LSDYTPTPTLATADPERSRAFYEGTLGLTPGEEAGGGLYYPAGSGAFFVYPSTFAGTNQATSMSFEVPAAQFDAEIAALRDNGVGFDEFEAEGVVWENGVAQMEGLRSVWFQDPDGNIINVESRIG
jgi:catechol 2,3-dioxygenase-like lactoylglutathione lyase family enzyme